MADLTGGPLQARILKSGYVRFSEMTWPIPGGKDGELEYRCRYAEPEAVVKERFQYASVLAAYEALVWASAKKRAVVIRELRKAAKQLEGNA